VAATNAIQEAPAAALVITTLACDLSFVGVLRATTLLLFNVSEGAEVSLNSTAAEIKHDLYQDKGSRPGPMTRHQSP
jgi:hypothetical protein